MKKRLLSVFLSFCMILTLLPATALAADTQPFQVNGTGHSTLADALTAAADGRSDVQVVGSYTTDDQTDATALNTSAANIVIQNGGSLNIAGNYSYGALVTGYTGSITVHQGGALDLVGGKWFGGSDARMNITQGSVTISDTNKVPTTGVTWTLSDDAVVNVPSAYNSSYSRLNMQFNDSDEKPRGANLVIPEGAHMTVDGWMRAVSGSANNIKVPSSIQLDGTLTISDGGKLDFAAAPVLTIGSTGRLELNGTLNVDKNGKDNIAFENGAVLVSGANAQYTTNGDPFTTDKYFATAVVSAEKGGMTYYYVDGHKPADLEEPEEPDPGPEPEPEPSNNGIVVTDAQGQPVEGDFETVDKALAANGAATVTLNKKENPGVDYDYNLQSSTVIGENQTIVVKDGVTFQITMASGAQMTDVLTSKGTLVIEAGGRLELPTNYDGWIGTAEDRLYLEEGTATFQFSGAGVGRNVGTLTIDGTVSVPTGKTTKMEIVSSPLTAVISEGSTLTVNGTLNTVANDEIQIHGSMVVSDSGTVNLNSNAGLYLYPSASFTYKGVTIFGAAAQPAARMALMTRANNALTDGLFTVTEGVVQIGFGNGGIIVTIPQDTKVTVNDEAVAGSETQIAEIVVNGTMDVPEDAELTLDGITMTVAPTANLTGNGTVKVIGEDAKLDIQGSAEEETTEGSVDVNIVTDDMDKVVISEDRENANTIQDNVTEIISGIKVYNAAGEEILNGDAAFSSVAGALKATGAARVVLGTATDPYTLDTKATVPENVTLEIQDGATLTVSVASGDSTYPLLTESAGSIRVNEGGTLNLPGADNGSNAWIGGESARLNLTSGYVEFQFGGDSENAGTLTLNGDATVPSSQTAIMHLNGTPIDGVIAEGSTLTVEGTLKAVNGGEGDVATQLTVNGTLKAVNGTLAVADRASVEVASTGTLNLPLMSTDAINGTSDSTGMKGDIVVNGGAAVSYGSHTVLGEAGAMITLSEENSKATMNLADATLSLDTGTATVNAYNDGDVNALLVTDSGSPIPLKLTVGAGTTLNIPEESNGLNLPNDSSLTVNGTVNVEDTLIVHSTANLTSNDSGVVNIKGINGVVDIKHGDQTDGTVTAKMNISGGGQVKIEKGRTDSDVIAKSITGGTPVEVEGGGWVVKASGITVVKADESTETASSVAAALKVSNAKTITLAADADPYVLAVADNDNIMIPNGVTIRVQKDATLKITTSATPDLLTDSQGAIEVQTGGKLELPSNTSGGTTEWIGGTDARLNLGENGSATFQFASEDRTKKAGTLTVSGNVSIPAGKDAILHLGGVPIDAVISEDATVTVNGTLRAISGNKDTEEPSKLTVNGTLTVADSGKLEVGSRATVEVTGTLSLPVLSKAEMSGTSNTSADGIKGNIIINGGSTVSYAENTILGNNGYLTMTTGKATLNVSGANKANGTVSLTLNEGTATVNHANLRAFLVDDTTAIIPMDVTIASGATVNVPSGMKLTIVNGGSLTVAGDMNVDRGTLRLNSGAKLDGDVSVTNGGIVTLHSGDAGAKTTLNGSKINLASGGMVYSQFEADSNITGTIEKETEGGYTVDGMDGITFAYRYVSTEPVTPPDPEPETYTITFNANGGSVNPTTKETDTNGRLVSLPTPTRSGSYRFDGWFTTASGGTQITTATVFTQDTTVYAHWTYTGGGGSSSGGGSGGSSSSGYTITVEDTDHGSIRVSPSRASKGDTVTITVDPDAGYELGTLIVRGSNGERIDVERQSDTRYTFEMPPRRVTVEATFVEITEEPVPSGLPFTDVHTGDYYYDAVAWAVENGVTSGTSATTFSPNNACTRAQMVTFLWRAAGSPEPEATVNPFTDVSTSAYYYDAVLWAVERGITNGTSATTFSPDATVTRGQTVTFLWRYAGSPTTGTGSFTDVAADAYYATAVAWAAAEGVTSGTSATTFSPDAACTRAQIVTFLYRYLG